MNTSNFQQDFDFCIHKLEESDKFVLEYFEATVNVLRFLSEDTKTTRSDRFKEQMISIRRKLERKPPDKVLIKDGWTEDDVYGVNMAAEDFKDIWVKVGLDKKEVSKKKIMNMEKKDATQNSQPATEIQSEKEREKFTESSIGRRFRKRLYDWKASRSNHSATTLNIPPRDGRTSDSEQQLLVDSPFMHPAASRHDNEQDGDASHGMQTRGKDKQVALSVHGARMARVRHQLVDCLRRTDVILTVLLQKQYLTHKEYQQIKSQSCTYKIVQHLIDVIIEKSEAAFACFLDALKATQQEDLYRLLKEDGFQLDLGHRTVLLCKYKELIENIQVTPTLLSCLLQYEVLNAEEVDTIRFKPTQYEKINELLKILLRSSAKQYATFISLLPEAGHQHVQELLTARDGRASDSGATAFV